MPVLPESSRRRASDSVVTFIQQEIQRRNLQSGERICSERALQQATGISRAGVRESVRMLEREGLVRTKTGPGGGILVGQPITAPLGRTVEAFRHLSGVSSEALLDAWQELAVTCARLAAERAVTQDLVELQAIADRYQQLDFQAVTFDTVARLNLGFVRRVVEAAHNPILSLFLDALIDLIYSAASTRPPGLTQMQELVGVHHGLVRAIQAGDKDAAARRMYRHLTALRTQLSVTETQQGGLTRGGGS